MKKRITGAIAFFAGIFAVMFSMYIFITKTKNIDAEWFFLLLWMVIGGVSASLYVYWTSYGSAPFTENFKVEKENKILKALIEQKKLRKELEEE